MNHNREYEKFVKHLSRGLFTLNELRKLIENDYVANVSKEEPDKDHPKFQKYSVKLVDGDIYYIYVKH